MGRPAKFTRQALQAAALSIVDQQGLGALSMRALAQALGTGPMTLYNYVGRREDLDVLVVEAVVAEAVLPGSRRGARWQDQLLAVARAIWQAMRRHPQTIPLVLTRRSRAPGVFAFAEALLTPLAQAGFAGPRLLAAFRAVTASIVGLAQGELAGPLAIQAGESAAETVERFKRLPAQTYPRLIEIAHATAATGPDKEFEMVMGIVISGLESAAPNPPGR